MFAIVDIETTGGRVMDKITEIAIVVHDGNKIVEQYSTLLNPEISISYFITKLTGITNEMVQNAPKFHEVAKKIVELTQDKVFIAHNVGFDYNFIRKEFKNLGYDYKRKNLCTVKLSRKLIPALKSYSLGNLCEDLGIEVRDRHRALGDAMATSKLFEYLLSVNNNEHDLFTDLTISSLSNINALLDVQKIKDLPEEAGVYYFYDEQKELIYVGKSKNIYSRVMSHFNNTKVKKALAMRDRIADISYELTGSELVALLIESDDIKKNMPLYNRAQRRTSFLSGLYSYVNEEGYLCLKINKNNCDEIPIISFDSQERAKDTITRLAEKHNLCQKLCGLFDSQGACFHYSIRRCNGACIQEESADEYNKRVCEALKNFEFEFQNFFIIDTGRRMSERAVVKIENGKYKGLGYIDITESVTLNVLSESISYYNDNRDVQQIIRSYLKRNKVEKIIRF